MTVPTKIATNDISRLMCAKHPETALPPSRVRYGSRTGCGQCVAESPSRKIVQQRYRTSEKGRASASRYRASEKRRAGQRRASARYEASGRAASTRTRYRESPRGQAFAYARLQRKRNLRELEWLASDLTARVPQFTHLG